MNVLGPRLLRISRLISLGCCALAALGCGGKAQEQPVEGVITLRGAPLADATVTLLPNKATDPGPYTATTDSEGRFALGPVGDAGAGVQPGSYRLMITTVKQPPGADELTPPPTQKEIVPSGYSDGSHPIDVPEGGLPELKLELYGDGGWQASSVTPNSSLRSE